ncbi:lipoate--protein ligase [Ectothiorhodospira sp. BSL-9]|uniref:lipoate--protein ligase n=1 Tax=Ectothiorhodospira sp. BSL-9 TaxID=1442136 RepID=UPI0007B427F5|nr:lipoate--protein ligase [Ectothiorhodospira sp. BSL-9]ANB02674.1 ligase [Ectothiorhodospira sp. BSL-9]TVQ72554.1 MAG: lipoate--protein ligase family protein [Chromatiaceae bacterium]
MQLRVLDFGSQPALRSQAVYHGIAHHMQPGDTPVLTLVNPSSPYVCVGLHQDVALEVDEDYCQAHQLPIIRRHVGGGAVFLDQNQLFFHFIYPAEKAPRRVSDIYSHFIEPVIQTYHRLGVQAIFRPVNDIHVDGRKIGGTGAASIGDATLMVGSFMFDFDVDTMSRCLKVPSEKFRDKLRAGMSDYITTLTRELGEPPSRETVIKTFMEELAVHLRVEPVMDQATAAEEASIAEQEKELQDPEWTYQKGRRFIERGVKISADTHLAEGAFKAPGGLIRSRLLAKDDHIVDLSLSGDFTVFPEDGMQRLADALKGVPLTQDSLQGATQQAMRDVALDIPGVTHVDIATAITAAFRGA